MQINFQLLSINILAEETYGHSIEFWLYADSSTPVELEQQGDLDSALSFVWSKASQNWVVSSVTRANGYSYSSRRVSLPVGNERTVRIRRAPSGVAQFFLDGDLVMELNNPQASNRVYVRVYAASAEFSYSPGVFGTASIGRTQYAPPALLLRGPSLR